MSDTPPNDEKPKQAPLTINDGLGCITAFVVFFVCSAVGSMFSTGAGDVWKGVGAIALGVFGLGVVWVCAKYRS